MTTYYERNKDRIKAYQKKYCSEHAEEARARSKAWYAKNRAHPIFRLHAGLRKHGLTLDDYNAMLQAQEGRCKVCGGTNPAGRPMTAYPRGLVCTGCAIALGRLAKLGPDAVSNAIDVLWGDDDA